MSDPKALTAADAERMEELATAQDHRRLTRAEKAEYAALVERWQVSYSRALHARPVPR